mgnify:CR=1 FL=1|tara:strand:+ start:28510 stop:28920 length:411 start_codon:yes stop_codon:yes gene_type:complete
MKTISHKFVEYIPTSEDQDEGVVYITTTYNTAVHNCACGCGQQVVTPLTPTDWRLTYDGETVSLYPSIGNWSYECRSHYWIKNGMVVWAEDWTEERILANRSADMKVKNQIYHNPKENQKKKSKPFKWLSWLFNYE